MDTHVEGFRTRALNTALRSNSFIAPSRRPDDSITACSTKKMKIVLGIDDQMYVKYVW
jgi:hypothetical protein